FFLQAEDGIRVRNVTGVQTCALPILPDIILFPPGLIEDASALMELDLQALDANLLPALGAVGMIQGGTRALPVAMGGYGWARNKIGRASGREDGAAQAGAERRKTNKK